MVEPKGKRRESSPPYFRSTEKEVTRQDDFAKALQEEILGFMNNGTFIKVDRRKVITACRIFSSRFFNGSRNQTTAYASRADLFSRATTTREPNL